MKTKTILKTVLILIIGALLFAIPANAYATSTGFDDFWEDQGGLEDISGGTTDTNTNTNLDTNTTTDTNTNSNTNTTTDTNTNTTPNTNTDIPKAGLAEDTMMVVAIIVLGVTATYAFKKVKEYKNI